MVFELTPPYKYHSSLPKCVIRIDDNWYDCTSWRNSHPGGAQMCDEFHGKDATDAFYSLHSKEAIQKLKRMKALPLKEGDEPRDQVSLNFEKLLQQLRSEGWFERRWIIDFARNIMPVIVLCVVGTYLSYSRPFLATILIGLGMQQGGWLAHDFTHARGKFARFLANACGGMINAFSVEWWSNKHNSHHIFVNRKGMDADIHNEPALFLWVPDVSEDTACRRYQYTFYLAAYALLYVSWRIQSLRFALGSGNRLELSLMALNYLWLALLPWRVSLGSVLLGGFFVAVVVTVNHQTEEMIEHDEPYNYVVDQHRATRGVHCSDPFFEWFFGGMQYQLEHHLLPMVPRYRYPEVRRLLRKFSEDNGLPFHVEGVWKITKMNFDILYSISTTPALNSAEAKSGK
ncbi:delta-6 fatty acid desaturase [Leishmania major strain Friedlin]|uniref:Delta-6 fatty acid desaturase n=1 Tax=Leishmania major TaxID=5664 RepID=Q4Q058_LEIMA|nr:delta-6 fatty acid desaturase [Leishmania major strain Friedlin]CAG9584264.1 delta-6_fatty_acid_desaturase [Leishmania major strain Friedlin]CAJ09677.1 delta-6 fatty acid desaturase [Leishmania major strain Friedlin]|eukprot:XP_001687290.1 delta-6 fatty acid desaturase [Leishmania major strain Friedlin]